MVSLSIGIVNAQQRKFDSYDEVSTVAAEVKSFAKKSAGSSFAIDERRMTDDSLSEPTDAARRPWC